MSHFVQSLLDFFAGAVVPWGYLLVFAVGFAEAAVFLGIVFPGETVLLFAGFLAWRGDASLWLMMVMAMTGAAVGDSVSYEIGRRFGPSIRQSRLGQRLGEERWERAGRYLRDKGGKAVFLARWFTVLKSVVPALAGESRMRYSRFLAWNVAGAVAWGAFHVGVGYVAGESYRQVEHYLGIGGWFVLGALVIVGGIALVVHHKRSSRDGSDEDDHGADRDEVAEASTRGAAATGRNADRVPR